MVLNLPSLKGCILVSLGSTNIKAYKNVVIGLSGAVLVLISVVLYLVLSKDEEAKPNIAKIEQFLL